MNSKTTSMLEERKINVKIKLALLWVALMFFYIYNDILSLFQPGHVAELVGGQLNGIRFTQTLLLGAATLMAFPGFMVLLSLTLKARVNRIVNIVVGIFHIFVLIGTQFMGKEETWFFWKLYELLELVFLIMIILTAWKWPVESRNQ